MEEKTPRELLEEALRDLKPEDRYLVEKIKKNYERFLKQLHNDKIE